MDKNNDILQQAIDERIDAFIRGEMTTGEEATFKRDIQSNPELRDHVMASLALIRSIRSQKATEEQNIIQKYSEKRIRSMVIWACSIAAVFAIIFGYSKDNRYNELSAIVSPYYAEYSMDDISRGDTDSAAVAHLYTLFNNIKKQRYMTNIIAELEPIYVSLDTNFTYNAYANDIAWNLALAYIKDSQIDKAISLLEKLEVDNPDMPIAIKASELKKKLQD